MAAISRRTGCGIVCDRQIEWTSRYPARAWCELDFRVACLVLAIDVRS
jgi:hypothetical protein